MGDKYKDQGLTVIGVHTPEFAFEKKPENVRRAIPDFRIGFPVAIDSDYDKEGRPIIDPQNNKKAPDQGAATSVWCATNPRLDGMDGVYCADCDIARALPPDDSTELHGVRTRATDPIAAGRLWQFSEQLTGASID